MLYAQPPNLQRLGMVVMVSLGGKNLTYFAWQWHKLSCFYPITYCPPRSQFKFILWSASVSFHAFTILGLLFWVGFFSQPPRL